MLKFLKSIFSEDLSAVDAKFAEQAAIKKENTMKATIQPIGNKTGLFSGGSLVATYARERDARRGATRRGLALING